MAVAQEAIMADPLKAVRQYMQQKAPQKFVGRQRHHLLLVLVFVIFVSEGDLSIFQLLETNVGDGDTMGIAAQIIEDPIRTAEWRLGVDHPFILMERRHIPGETLGIGQLLHLAGELELPGGIGFL
jgi:hypothetical protein